MELANPILYKEIVPIKGVPTRYLAIRANGQTFIISGKFAKTAALRGDREQWVEDVLHPNRVIDELKAAPVNIDLFKFWQRIPDLAPKYPYFKEWREIAAIPISDYKHWFDKQISPKARNKVRKAQKFGVTVEEVPLDDEFIRGVMSIYNQSPVRRGKPFWHYGKDFATVKKELSADLAESVFVAAYFKKELIGFTKFRITDRYAMTLLILDKTAHRDKAPMNAMIAKVVEICARRQIPYFTYTVWRRGEHGHFQESNGFEKIAVPEYFVPLSPKGKLVLWLRLHNGLRGWIPEKLMGWLLSARAKWYSFKYSRSH
jgi:hypothetical protein